MNQFYLEKSADQEKQLIASSDSISYEQARTLKKESTWKDLALISVRQAIEHWLRTLSALTAKNYACGINQLIALGLLNLEATLQAFTLTNHEVVVDQIKSLKNLAESTKQARAACYISFTKFLHRRTSGIIPKALPNREGVEKTFFRVREKVATEAMSRAQWITFLQKLHDLNKRDWLIAQILLQGAKRVSEVLLLTTDKIDYTQREIRFRQSKTKGYEKETVITYPQTVMDNLKEYISNRQGIVFVTRTENPIMLNQLAITFAKAGKLAGIPFKVTPHVLRTTAVTYLKREGFSDGEIMKVTGHASAEMVYAYDKSERSQNASQKVSLV